MIVDVKCIITLLTGTVCVKHIITLLTEFVGVNYLITLLTVSVGLKHPTLLPVAVESSIQPFNSSE